MPASLTQPFVCPCLCSWLQLCPFPMTPDLMTPSHLHAVTVRRMVGPVELSVSGAVSCSALVTISCYFILFFFRFCYLQCQPYWLRVILYCDSDTYMNSASSLGDVSSIHGTVQWPETAPSCRCSQMLLTVRGSHCAHAEAARSAVYCFSPIETHCNL